MRISFLVRVLPLLLLCIDVALVSGLCQTDQQSLLLQLSNSLRYNQSKSAKLVHWNLSSDCCTWPGVACDQSDLGRVVGLNLSRESITGGIERSQLFSFQYLQNLDLSYNNFNTTLPTGFGNLTNLISLNLSNAGFVGQIPIEISYMTELVSLDLSMLSILFSQRLKLEDPNLAELVKNLSKLKELNLDGVNISASGNEWCQALSSSLPNLQVLSMSNCFLSGPFDPSLRDLKFLSVIRLTGNNFSAAVPEFFAEFTDLRELHLRACSLKGTFPENILQHSKLEILDLALNEELQGQVPDEIQSVSLKTLVLSNTKFSGRLPESISVLGNLTRIELDHCNFVGEIPSMEKLTELVYLDFSFNNFTGQIPSLDGSRKLMNMDFSHNELSGEIPPTYFEGLKNLVHLNLRNNLLNGSLPHSLFALPSLQKIFLSSNQFGGQVPDFSNASFSSLDTLDMSSNKLEGPIPSSFFNLTRLNVLVLPFNNFTGTIKLDRIQSLQNLTTIDLSFNNLEVDASTSNSAPPSFPQFSTIKLASCSLRVIPNLKNQSKLLNLDLSRNQIDGAVPQWIGGLNSLSYLNLSWNLLTNIHESLSLSNLYILDLQHNQLEGTVPTPPPSASIVDYSNNNFASFIPPDIGKSLTFSFFFSLANNSLVGSVPESLCNASYLQVLDLSDNSLNGSIPSCLIGMSEIRVLNLKGNNFFGGIPDKFPSTCNIRTLDVNGNQIEGQVPQTLANCSMLEVLDLGNNKMKDTFPCLLKNLTRMRVLVLRNNKLFGSIGCPSNHGPWPMLQIVDLAYNNFSGMLPNTCLETWDAMKRTGNETHDHLGFQYLQLGGSYYQDSVTVTSKGLQMQLVKILTVFTSIDFSSNSFEGPIPDAIGKFGALYLLNLSHNALTGQILPFLGNLSQLESLDLSDNHFTGTIPSELVYLTFLSVLNLSNNQLIGSIPEGNQFMTFDNSSYQGNVALCGFPLSKSCPSADTLPPARESDTLKKKGYSWEFIVPGLGFGVGAAAVVSPLLFWKKAHKWYDNRIDKLLMVLLPVFGLIYYRSNDWRRISPDYLFEEDSAESDADKVEDECDYENEGRYCVFCTKLDITRKHVIHDPKCTCYNSPPISPSSTSSFLGSDSS